jgi:hypothetical protein
MMIDSSRYWEVFDYYRQSIDESRIKIVWFEDFIKGTGKIFLEICRFLDIDEVHSIFADELCRNSRSQVLHRISRNSPGRSLHICSDWDPETRAWVIEQLRDDNCRFLRHFGKPPDYWDDLYCKDD